MIVFFGPPGCGKGTQASLLCKEYGYVHIATGNLLKSIVNKELLNTINSGMFVEDDYVCDVVGKKILETIDNKILLDGFPRTTKQVEFLHAFSRKNFLDIKIFLFNIDLDKIVGRIENRAICNNCCFSGTIDMKFCPNCGHSDFVKRSDDNDINVIRNRLNAYKTSEKEVLESLSCYFGNNMIVIDAHSDHLSVNKNILMSLNEKGE